jgi:hypothetical protein
VVRGTLGHCFPGRLGHGHMPQTRGRASPARTGPPSCSVRCSISSKAMTSGNSLRGTPEFLTSTGAAVLRERHPAVTALSPEWAPRRHETGIYSTRATATPTCRVLWVQSVTLPAAGSRFIASWMCSWLPPWLPGRVSAAAGSVCAGSGKSPAVETLRRISIGDVHADDDSLRSPVRPGSLGCGGGSRRHAARTDS